MKSFLSIPSYLTAWFVGGTVLVGREGLVSAAINATASALDLISFAIIARILSPDSFGVFLVALAVGMIIERVGSPNLAQSFMRHSVRAIEANQKRDLRRILDLSALCDTTLLASGVIGGLLTAVLIVPQFDVSAFFAVLITVVSPALRPPILAAAVPRAFGRHVAVVAWLLLGALAKVAILTWVLWQGGDLLAVAFAFAAWRLIAGLGGLAITAAEARRHGALSVRRSNKKRFEENHKEFFTFTRAGALAVLPQAVIEFSTVLIAGLSGVVTAGFYRLGTKVGEAARIYTNPIGYALYSEQCKGVERGESLRIRSQTVRSCVLVGLITTAGAIVFILAGDHLVPVIFGEAYEPAIPAITWCIVAAVPYSISTLLQFGLFSFGAAIQVLRSESVAATLIIVLLAVLQTPSAEQAAIVLAISRGAVLPVLVLLFFHELHKFGREVDDREALSKEAIVEAQDQG